MPADAHRGADHLSPKQATTRLVRFAWLAVCVMLMLLTGVVSFGVGAHVGTEDMGEDLNAIFVAGKRLSQDIKADRFSPDERYYVDLCDQPLKSYGHGYVQYHLGNAEDRAVRIDFNESGSLRYHIVQ